MFKYQIGDKVYTQKELCPIQLKFLLPLLREVKFTGFATADIVASLGDKFSLACAFVLRDEKGKIPWMNVSDTLRIEVNDEKLKESMLHITENCGLKASIQIAEDFFFFNEIVLLLERLSGMMEKVAEKITSGLMNSSASSQAETLQKETESSGDTA